MIDRICESIVATCATAASLWGGMNLVAARDVSSWLDVFERGGFLLVTLVGLGLFGWLVVPKLLDWAKDYLEDLKETNKQQIGYFLTELEKGRDSRERTEEAFREALHDSKKETVAAIKEQTGYVADLVKELKGRPPQ